jgi:DNA-directed RNA polymerase alpha subunit
MGPGADLIIHTSEEKQILPQTLTPEQENILNTKSIDDLGLSKARISFITNGLKVTTLRELIEYPEEEIFKFRRGTKKTIEKIREGLLKLGLGLAKTE